jgi:hypothetical protein
MAKSDTLEMMAKVVLKHDALFEHVAWCLMDIINVMVAGAIKCECSDCQELATVKHRVLNKMLCDRHCAEAITQVFKGPPPLSPDDAIEDWPDMDHAESVRRCVDALKRKRNMGTCAETVLH